MTINGPVVLDIAQHFIERWNEVKKRKVLYQRHLTHLIKYAMLTVKSLSIVKTSATFYDTTITCLLKDGNRKFVWLALPHEPEAAPNEWASR